MFKKNIFSPNFDKPGVYNETDPNGSGSATLQLFNIRQVVYPVLRPGTDFDIRPVTGYIEERICLSGTAPWYRLEWFAGPGRTGGGGGLTRYRTLTVQLPVHTGHTNSSYVRSGVGASILH